MLAPIQHEPEKDARDVPLFFGIRQMIRHEGAERAVVRLHVVAGAQPRHALNPAVELA